MRRALPSLVLLAALAACAVNMGGGREVPVPTVAVRVDAGVSADAVAEAVRGSLARVALIAAPGDAAWFARLAEAAELTLSGPGEAGDGLRLAFLGPEAVGDTTIELTYAGGAFTLHDALYELPGGRYLDLMSFRVDSPGDARPAIASLMAYVATDVMPQAAVVMAVAVPNEAVGDSVARMFSPGYFDARRCAGADAVAAGETIRLFYGPEARIACRGAEARATVVGDWIRAELVATRR